jgi:uncharacterized membrane protein/mono/diheme cytochrome c family protein
MPLHELLALPAHLIASTEVTLFTPLRGVGRFHPILVHFPIALTVTAAFLELVRVVRRLPGLAPTTAPLLLIAGLCGVAAATSGWLFAAQDYAGDTRWQLEAHRWWGTGAALLLIVIAIMAWRSARLGGAASGSRFEVARPAATGTLPIAIRAGGFAAAGVILMTGHLGGELVYGPGFLARGFVGTERVGPAFDAAGDAARAAPNTADARLAFFRSDIEPLLAAHCIECHGERKQKGGLRLDPIAAAFSGDPRAWTIRPGDPDGSELLRRVLLPREDDEAMPPGDEGLKPSEIDALRRWIAEGAAHG